MRINQTIVKQFDDETIAALPFGVYTALKKSNSKMAELEVYGAMEKRIPNDQIRHTLNWLMRNKILY